MRGSRGDGIVRTSTDTSNHPIPVNDSNAKLPAPVRRSPPACSRMLSDDEAYDAMILERMAKWDAGMWKVKKRVAPGFVLPWEDDAISAFRWEIEKKCREIAATYGDRQGACMAFVKGGGYVQVHGQECNTGRRLIRALLSENTPAEPPSVGSGNGSDNDRNGKTPL